jgi:hypothetical protein
MSYLDMARSILNGLPTTQDVTRLPCEKSEKSEKTLDPEVAWRATVMRAQIPLRGAIPFLLARSDLSAAPGRCGSCGDALAAGQRYRCAPCQEAAWLALNEAREGVPTGDPT